MRGAVNNVMSDFTARLRLPSLALRVHDRFSKPLFLHHLPRRWRGPSEL